MGKRQSFTRAFKLEAVRLLQSSGRPIADVARELAVRRNQLYKWHEQLQSKGPDEVFGVQVVVSVALRSWPVCNARMPACRRRTRF